MTDRLDTMRAMAARQPNNALVRFGLANELLKANLLEEAATELAAYLAAYDDEGNGWLRYCDTLSRWDVMTRRGRRRCVARRPPRALGTARSCRNSTSGATDANGAFVLALPMKSEGARAGRCVRRH